MTIKLRTLLCGPDGNLHPGVHTLDPAQEKALVDSGCAEFVKSVPPIETATGRVAENAAKNPPRRRGAKE